VYTLWDEAYKSLYKSHFKNVDYAKFNLRLTSQTNRTFDSIKSTVSYGGKIFKAKGGTVGKLENVDTAQLPGVTTELEKF
jgi:hypothetical protein